jgi:hypothetical protein
MENKPVSREGTSDCVIPGTVPDEVLAHYGLRADDDEADRIRRYVEWQAPDGTVKHLEKVATESVFGQQMDAWDVRTDKDRWWVITNPTNFYSHRLFPSLEYTLSFHVGLTTRMLQAEMCQEQQRAHDQMNQLWNKVAGARSTHFMAKKVEAFQAVGMKCRECLLFLVQALGQPEMVPEGEDAPQRGNFIGWCELIANHFAPGGSNERLRAHLKGIAKSTWHLVDWLTHSQSAGRFDGSIATEATDNLLETFMMAWARYQAPKQAVKRMRRARGKGSALQTPEQGSASGDGKTQM